MAHCRYGCKPSTYSGGYCWNSSGHPNGRGVVLEMKYKPGDVVWLKECSEEEYGVYSPREQALVVVVEEKDMYAVAVKPSGDPEDDGLREVHFELIDGIVPENQRIELEVTPQGKRYLKELNRATTRPGHK